MDDDVSSGEIYRLLLEVRGDVKAQNGRVNSHDTDIAVVQERLRSISAEMSVVTADGRKWGAGTGAVAGGFVAGLIAGLGQYFGGSK